MRDWEFERTFVPAVEAVLETMFFSAPLGLAESDLSCLSCSKLEARVAFSGKVSGILDVRVSAASARSLAASFLGEDEESLPDAEIAQVVCELANMLCGWMVSKPESEGSFDLDAPEMVAGDSERPLGIPILQQSFALESGTLTVSLYTSEPL
jgi:CheY-specific phosphatase CheX